MAFTIHTRFQTWLKGRVLLWLLTLKRKQNVFLAPMSNSHISLSLWFIWLRNDKYVNSYFEKGWREKCARDNLERKDGIWSIYCSSHCSCRTSRGGGTPYMKMVGMLVVSLKVVNFGFWSRLGLHAKKYKNIYLICVFLIRFIYSIHIIQVFSFVCVLTWSLLGVKKSLGHAQIGLL